MATGRYHWSNCAPPAQFFKINAVASVPWLALILYPSWTSFYVALTVTGVLLYIEIIKKMSIVAFLRAVNIALTGCVKSTMNLAKELTK